MGDKIAVAPRSTPGCVGWLAGVEPISNRLLEAVRDLRVINRNGNGVDNFDVSRAAARGVAELAIDLLLTMLRRIPWSHNHLKRGDGQRRVGRQVKGRTLAVIGCGAIGLEVVEMALGLGMTARGYDPFASNSFARLGFAFAPLEECLATADAITFHCPPSGRPILDAAATGTDVFTKEPPQLSPLLMHEHVIPKPHAGGLTDESVVRATNVAIDNLPKILATS